MHSSVFASDAVTLLKNPPNFTPLRYFLRAAERCAIPRP